MTRIRFEDLPSTNTPRNAENLNKLNNVVISSTEPNTGEEVWFKTKNNLFDKSTITRGYFINASGNPQADNTASYSDFISLQVGEYYSANKNFTYAYYNSNKEFVSANLTPTTTIAASYPYVKLNIYTSDIDVFKFEQNSENKKIYTKNDNGAYEEFYNDIWEDITSQITMKSGYTLVRGKLYKKGKQIIGNLTVSGTFTSGQTSTIMELPYRTSAAHMDYCGFSNSDWSVKNIGYLYYDQDVIVSPNTTSQTHVIVDFNYITKQ